jgi:prepilin-type N-terminal cleavage/methylation domain-containing protein
MRAHRGFTLVEILIVVVILGLITAMAAVLLRSVSVTQKRSLTNSRMANVEAAIVQFVMQQKRLPCPADGTQPGTTGGLEMYNLGPPGSCIGNQQNGVVPWRSLGLSAADILDGWDRRMTYRVSTPLVLASSMDLSWCDPAGTGALVAGFCNSVGTCSSAAPGNCTPPSTYLQNKGLAVKGIGGTDLMFPNGNPPGTGPFTGAAYVLISHGESGGGAFLDTGVLASSTTTDGTEEQKNYATQVLQAYYVDDQPTDVAGAAHFDDVVLRPSVLSVATRAGLGPRSH